jgi:hypothetical protein
MHRAVVAVEIADKRKPQVREEVKMHEDRDGRRCVWVPERKDVEPWVIRGEVV